jgi:cysteine desulfurase
MNKDHGYFDHNATTPISGAALAAWQDAATRHWQNPSSLYREAGEARNLLEVTRETLADYFGIDEAERLVFTSGATEANNAVIRHLAAAGGVIAISGLEHPCVQVPVEALFPEDRVRRIPVVAGTGVIDFAVLGQWITDGEVHCVSVMAANNETGALQPWREIAELCREAGVRYHNDAAQWIGKGPVAGLERCDFVTGSGHKFGGGKGTGFLILPEDFDEIDFHGQIGGPQEDGRRAGTEDLPGIVAMVAALTERPDAARVESGEGLAAERDAFERRIEKEIGCRLLAAAGPRLWNTSMFVLPHTKNLKWLTRLSQRGFSVSTGAACSAGKGNPSTVMAAMGLDYGEMGRVIRVSGGWTSGGEEWDALARALVEVGRDLRDQ